MLKNLESRIANLKSGLDRLRTLPHVVDVRQCGFIGAVEVGPFPIEQRMGIKICAEMRKRGVLTRPIGNTIVIMPPYCVTDEQLKKMLDVLRDAINVSIVKKVSNDWFWRFLSTDFQRLTSTKSEIRQSLDILSMADPFEGECLPSLRH